MEKPQNLKNSSINAKMWKKCGIYLVGKDSAGFTKKWAMEFLKKITAYPNEAIHDDCVVAFTGGYEKIEIKKSYKKTLRLNEWLIIQTDWRL